MKTLFLNIKLKQQEWADNLRQVLEEIQIFILLYTKYFVENLQTNSLVCIYIHLVVKSDTILKQIG